MRRRISALLRDENLKARALRGAGLTMISIGGQNVLRLVSNMVLTRLLFPEAFGMMTLVQVFMTGIQMFSDIGINTSIIQSKRGDDPDFINTGWTLKVVRGFILWLVACLLAYPAAQLYDEPMIAFLLPIVGFNAVITGFGTTKAVQENRHMRLGRQTAITLGCQAVGLVVTAILAWQLRSVWALVWGGLFSTAAQNIILRLLMPGVDNRFCWDRTAVREILGFGQFIFLSTLAGFLINQGDRAILGGYISMAELGIYNIGFFLGTFPLIFNRAINSKVLFPLYRLRPPSESQQNRKHILRARRLQMLGSILPSVLLGFIGPSIVELMYDDRYLMAGPMVTLFSLAAIPQMVMNGYTGAFLASGDSKGFFWVLLANSVVQTILLFLGIQYLGVFGAIMAPCLAALLTYPLRAVLVRRHGANDPLGDAVALIAGMGLSLIACLLYQDQILALIG